jgi:hypothetical protein
VKLEERINKLKAEREKIASQVYEVVNAELASSMAGLITRRVQRTGIDYKGSPFFPYSASWADTRESKGHQTQFKDFTFTGDMWLKFGMIASSLSGTKISFTLGGLNDLAKKKINWNSKLEAISIIKANKVERKLLRDSVYEILSRVLK